MDGSKHRLKNQADALPDKPGIYFFVGGGKEILYIGKARSLKDRVHTYFLPTTDAKVLNILSEARHIDYILTESEREAAFLENNFIQQYQPKFNERLKDDKSFPYLKITADEDYPAITLTRRVEPDGARYFGPFNPAHQARKTIHLVNRHFGIRDCRETIPSKRRRPCLQHDLGLCSAPCTGLISREDYRDRVDNALLFLEGRVDDLIKILKTRMKAAADALEFELAGHWRDLILALDQIKVKPRFVSPRSEDKDIFGFSRSGADVALFVFFMRGGKVSRSEGIVDTPPDGTDDQRVLGTHILSFYRGRNDLPSKILLPFAPADRESLARTLSELRGSRVTLHIPVRGKNRKLAELADRNAALLLEKRSLSESPVEALREVLGLDSPPLLIEGYDISNTGGDESVGARVVFRHGRPDPPSYRKYRIRDVSGPNDTASLREVLRRRFSRIGRNDEDFPDLVLVDGGKGQLSAAGAALEALGMGDTALVSLAKREEIIFSSRFPQGLRLDRTSPALRLLQNVRDEAHRFAVTYHRQRRTRKSFASILDGIPGIGPERKKRLLTRYKGLEAIARADPDEIDALIGSKAATALRRTLREGGGARGERRTEPDTA